VRHFAAPASLLAMCAIALACSPSSVDTAPTTSSIVLVAPDDTDDGRLVIGVLLPSSGDGAEIGMSMRNGAELAISEINRNGGVNGDPVATEVADEGDTSLTAARAVAELLDRDVDVIIGPASSLNASTTLPVSTAAGVLSCSPSANSLALDGFPDQGLFVRTIPSDSLQAAAMANYLEGTGLRDASIVYIGDSYGRDFAEAVFDELIGQDLTVAQVIAFDPSDDDYSDEAVRATVASMVAVIGDNEAGARMVEALFEAGDDQIEIVVNDAMRVPSAAGTYQRLAKADREHLRGVSPRSHISDTAFQDAYMARYPESRGLFAANAYDCVNVIALAANAADSTEPTSIAQQLHRVTTDGTPCSSFPICDELRANERDIDYQGPSGRLDLGADGEPEVSEFELFGYDDDGVDIALDTVIGA
jgi:branched-chain amino acid transport system substrate-binding protein